MSLESQLPEGAGGKKVGASESGKWIEGMSPLTQIEKLVAKTNDAAGKIVREIENKNMRGDVTQKVKNSLEKLDEEGLMSLHDYYLFLSTEYGDREGLDYFMAALVNESPRNHFAKTILSRIKS